MTWDILNSGYNYELNINISSKNKEEKVVIKYTYKSRIKSKQYTWKVKKYIEIWIKK